MIIAMVISSFCANKPFYRFNPFRSTFTVDLIQYRLQQSITFLCSVLCTWVRWSPIQYLFFFFSSEHYLRKFFIHLLLPADVYDDVVSATYLWLSAFTSMLVIAFNLVAIYYKQHNEGHSLINIHVHRTYSHSKRIQTIPAFLFQMYVYSSYYCTIGMPFIPFHKSQLLNFTLQSEPVTRVIKKKLAKSQTN